MALDLETLLAPVSATDRAGPDLAYDAQRHEIEQAFDAPISIDANGAAVAEAETDWRRIITAIAAQSGRTKDVWLAVYLCRAGARAGDLATVEIGAAYLAGLIDRFWDEAHPRLEEYGIEGRTGACDTLASFPAFLGPLRATTLLDHPRHGRFVGNDLQRFGRGGEAEPGYGAFRATLEEPASVALLASAVTQLETIDGLFRRVDAALAERAGIGAGASFEPLYLALAEIRDAAQAFLPKPEIEELPIGDAGEGAGGQPSGGPVRSRSEVIRGIDQIIDYYRRSEPHSPVPLLLARAREWVNRDFLEVLEDIAPNAMNEARHLLHYRKDGG